MISTLKWLKWALLCATLVAANAYADTITDYTINFTATSGAAPTGSFAWDSTTDTFQNFVVKWDGETYTFPDVFTSPPQETYAGCGGTASVAVFELFAGGCRVAPISFGVNTTAISMFGVTNVFLGGTFPVSAFCSVCTPTVAGLAGQGTVGSVVVTTGSGTGGGTGGGTSVPEPGTAGLMLLGFGLVLGLRKRVTPA